LWSHCADKGEIYFSIDRYTEGKYEADTFFLGQCCTAAFLDRPFLILTVRTGCSDQVRFGGVPRTDDSREETFRLAESFAERLGRYKDYQKEEAESLDGLLRDVLARGSGAQPSDSGMSE
jgi:hypothetical protein